MQKGFKIRLFPTSDQEQKLWQSVGTARFAWNWGIEKQQRLYKDENKTLSGYELRKLFNDQMRKNPEYGWLNEVAWKVVVTVLDDLDGAYTRFFKKQAQYPKFKSRRTAKAAFGVPNDTIKFYEDGVQVPKIGHVRFKSEFPLPFLQGMKIYNPRFSNRSGKWIMSFSSEVPFAKADLTEHSVGIDLGVKTLAVVSCAGKFYKARNINKSHKTKRKIKQLEHLQRAFSRKQKDSKNREKALNKVRKYYAKLSNIRLDHTHKTTTKIINLRPKRIVIENLNVQGMMKNRHLSRAIQEQMFYEFRRQLEYKARAHGIELKVVDRFYPSSKTCSCCDNVLKELKLSDRVYVCPVCGLVMDRDENAARNLEKAV